MAEDAFAVSYLRHDMRGAPVINGNTPGCMIAALDALLVTGWGPAAPQSLTVAAGVATATFASATPWEVGAVIKISGATPEAINGKARVLSSSGNTLTFATAASAGTYSGTVDIRYCPADWEKVFSATNKAVYRSKDPLGNRHYLRVDDSGALYSRVAGFVGMSGIDDGVDMYPSINLIDGGGYWWKSYAVNSAKNSYIFAADSRMMLVAIATYSGYWGSEDSPADIRGFGDPIFASSSGDGYGGIICYRKNSNTPLSYTSLSGGYGGGDDGIAVARAYSGAVGAVMMSASPETGAGGNLSGADGTLGAAPSPVDGSIRLSRVFFKEYAPGAPVRAYSAGVYYVPQSGLVAIFGKSFACVDFGVGQDKRRLAVVHQSGGTTISGVAFIDVTGPWR